MTTDLMTKALKVVCSRNTVLPILESVKIADGSLFVTDLRTSLQIKDVVSLDCVPFCLSLRDLTDTVFKFEDEFELEILPEIKPDPVTNSEGQPQKAIFRVGKRTYKFFSDDADDFPNIPSLEEPIQLGELSYQDIEKIVLAAGFTSTDDFRPNMNYVALEAGEVIATDSHRLYFNTTDFKGNEKVYLNRKTCKLLSYFRDEDFTVTIGKDATHITLESDSVLITQRNMDDIFPDWKPVIPTKNPISLDIDRKELEKSINEALKFANKTTHQVRFKANGTVLLNGEDLDFGTEFECELEDCKKEGGDIEIGFNGKLLLTCFPKDADRIKIALSTPNRAGIVNDHYLIMPVMLNQYA